jgi:hypothetical protein
LADLFGLKTFYRLVESMLLAEEIDVDILLMLRDEVHTIHTCYIHVLDPRLHYQISACFCHVE